MIKTAQLPFLLKKSFRICLSSGIHTDNVLSARFKKYQALRNEPGIKGRQELLKDEDFLSQEFDESILDERVDKMHFGRTREENLKEMEREKRRTERGIISKKFFSPQPQPPTLTYNERLCIKHLHKEDPIQWNVKTLSESFPATPHIIKKILKSSLRYSPEVAKAIDKKVQRNWELLAEGKLNAEPEFIEHLKKFMNRREVLLEQLKNEKIYLPEVKKEPVWNQGEMSDILESYEKDLKKLAESENKTALPGEEKDFNKEKKSSLDLLHERIKENAPSRELETKDSFVLGEMINTYSKNTTLEELEKTILRRAEKRKKLNLMEKAILENQLNSTSQENERVFTKSKSYPRAQEEKELFSREKTKPNFKEKTFMKPEKDKFKKTYNPGYTTEETPSVVYPDERTQFGIETDVGKLLNKKTEKIPKDTKNKTPKKEIDFSDPERLRREAEYYDKEVSFIQNTSFWNSGRSSLEKSMAEREKNIPEKPANVPATPQIRHSHIFSSEPYPERIKIPKKMQGSGMVFKVKDCYYDDDGEFLYRVPGMYK